MIVYVWYYVYIYMCVCVRVCVCDMRVQLYFQRLKRVMEVLTDHAHGHRTVDVYVV